MAALPRNYLRHLSIEDDMAFVIKQKQKPTHYYAGPDKGWIDIEPPPDPDPKEHVSRYASKEEAAAVIKQHGMDAEVEEISDAKEPPK